MRRRDSEKLLDELVETPWWVSVALAAAAYGGIRYLAPVVWSDSAIIRQLATYLAGPVAFVFVVAALLSLLRAWVDRRRLDRQTGIHSIRSLTWEGFERLIAEAYRRRGFAVQVKGGANPDGGCDLILHKDGTYLVQCKHWRNYRVGVKEARELLGIVHAKDAAGGILVTSGDFTPEARDFVTGQPLELVNGSQLTSLLRLPELARPSESAVAHETPPNCPSCGRVMVVRLAKRGRAAGKQFWGCSGYPTCRATLDL